MADDPFMAELRLMSFNYAPSGWAQCNGQLLPINQNQALFSLLGTMYGGNGQTVFALPDLRGRTPFHMGNGLTQGQSLGETSHTLTLNELPAHNHPIQASALTGSQALPGLLASANNMWGPPTDLTTVVPATLGTYGGSQPHENSPPSLVLMWCIALRGIFPSQN
ncbi:MAG: tail fiber protein [Herbiconiux sp.]|nr:tail fiber protein [Herbiconiux sp.]